ncbi:MULTISPECIES: molybdopterin-dependent oxidoreductase [unclassified Halorhodospira]|uniref:molybdopterin-dependent oxidoreductase n=1 Tax=unclassified Halorhodospira TaxID=2626748 RepID=UPI001EE93B81|nr:MULTISPECIES: molybdopterin-dependent oxidoreductase [unclassified Halorhodospira]MCG5540365.1 molybdopterin-dependent oxidoreductase [Halorhodospira sp. M39old]MCG5545782.1 molybdopterin-dependent oxidoreductase [Halorhodospira sp. M38]
MSGLDHLVSRRRFLQATGVGGAAAATGGIGHLLSLSAGGSRARADAHAENPATQITKNVCHQCPARCGIDVYTTDGRVHAIYGDPGNPIANGRLCPKGHLGSYILYDPDRFKGPMKRTNPNKGRDEDPQFEAISWDEALDIVAERLNRLREREESHRFALMYGRGWGASCAGLLGPFAQLYGSPNVIGHSSMCSDGSMVAKGLTDGNEAYNAYDYRNTNYILNFGAGFLEAFRPYNYLMQVWGHMRTKSPKTRVTAVDVHMNPTLAAADRAITIKPATDGAMALAIAHEMLVQGYWDRDFVGDFTDGTNRFEAGTELDPDDFEEIWTQGLIRWWNEELKNRTPEWAEEVTTVPAETIRRVAYEFGTTRPAMAIMERGPTSHSNGTYNGMAIHALNALAGSLFAKGGLFYQMDVPYGDGPAEPDDYMDDYAERMQERFDNGEIPRIDKLGTDHWPLARNMMQEVGPNHAAGDPYKLDTILFYLNNPIWTAPDSTAWEEALKDVFIIDTSPFPGETAQYADLILPDHTYLERLQDAPTYPFEGYPMTALRTPAVEPLYDTKVFGDILIEIGKRLDGPAGEYWQQVGDTENLLRHLAEGFKDEPGDNGVTDFESWKEKGVWYKKPYHWKQERGVFYEWVAEDGDYTREMSAEEVREKLMPTPSGRFEFFSEKLQEHADFVASEFGIDTERAGLIQWVDPDHPGGGDLYFSTPKTALHAEGRGANIPHAIAHVQPVMGGRTTVYLEIHPRTAHERGITSGDKVRIISDVGEIEAYARLFEGTRPDTVCLPMEHGHWAQGRWAEGRKPGHSGEVTVNQSDRISGLASYYTTKVRVERA